MPFRFVHTADLHLDSPLRSLALRDPGLAELIGDSTRQALTAIVDLCLEERVDALIVAGDLYDGDQTSMKTARFLADQMERLHRAEVAVFMIRGNHDALSKITPQLILPPSLTVFGGRAGTAEIARPGLDVALHGLSFSRPQAPESLLPKFRPPVPDAANIGILHTSLGGAAGHDVYAPCAAADLHAFGYDYWALGHIHQRAEHAGPRRVVMPGMPQGRDVNEAGAKTATLVAIGDDRSVTIEERPTSAAQFERATVDLSGAADWREAIDRIERGLGAVRDRAASAHLVVRLTIAGETPLAFRLRRDPDLLREEVARRAEGLDRTWIEKIEMAATPPRAPLGPGPAGDPLVELGALMRGAAALRPGLREELGALVREIRDDLPAEARGFAGADEAEFEALVDRLLAEGAADAAARLASADPEAE